MPRKPRQKSETGIYHVMVRGINQQDIFHDEDDFKRYLEILKKVSFESGVSISGYCLMTNHVHLLIREGDKDVSAFMKRLGISYAYWYNWKYERTGHVFQDRFKSEGIESNAYLLTVIRYIHQNPVKAAIVRNPEEYRWSSCAVYYKYDGQTMDCLDTKLILSILSEQEKEAIERFRKYMEECNEDRCLDYCENRRVGDTEAYQIIKKIIKGRPVTVLQTMDQEGRSKILNRLRNEYGLSLRQLSRITGLPFHIVRKS